MASRNLRGLSQQKAAKLLEDITTTHLINNPNLVFAKDNKISAFGIYTIEKNSNRCKIYKRKVVTAEVNSIQAAMSWCVADKYNLYDLKTRLVRFDKELERRQNDLVFYKSIINSSADYESKSVILDRISECNNRYNFLKKQLTKCINSAKYCQQKGFDNETSRLGFQKHN